MEAVPLEPQPPIANLTSPQTHPRSMTVCAESQTQTRSRQVERQEKDKRLSAPLGPSPRCPALRRPSWQKRTDLRQTPVCRIAPACAQLVISARAGGIHSYLRLGVWATSMSYLVVFMRAERALNMIE